MWMGLAILAFGIGLVDAVVGSSLHGTAHHICGVLLVDAIFPAMGVSVIAMFYETGRWHKEASECLGIPLRWYHDSTPPVRDDVYRSWCSKRGLVPYGAESKCNLDTP
jgi:hypothetical protein